jgi:para-aminobenzoate synthetase/4-amino-4-deoxychorismate lyase
MSARYGLPQVILREDRRGKWLHFAAPRGVLVARRRQEVLPLLEAVTAAVEGEGLYAAGFIAYEAAPAFDSALPAKADGEFPLAWFGLFDKPIARTALPPPDPAAAAPPWTDWRPSVDEEEYRRAFAAIRRYIRDGETYQINLTLRLTTRTNLDPRAFFLRLMAEHEAPYGAFIDAGDWAVCSASPELFFRLAGRRIESRPMKGTAPRGLWPEDDLARAAALRASEKERAENVMITDMVRNDLGRIAARGSVRVPRLFTAEKYPTLWQMTSTVAARTEAPLPEILRALFPPASITGAPKRRAMEIIAEVESTPRRLYTGAIGFIAPGRRCQFSVAIRTVLLRPADGHAEYGVGGGIVWDSTAAGELDECAVKALVLRPGRPPFDLLETMHLTAAGEIPYLEDHLARLARSADYFGFALSLPRLRAALARRAGHLPAVDHRLRLLVSRSGAFRCEESPFAAAALRFGAIGLAAQPVDARDPFLYHKTTRRGIYAAALALRPGASDLLLFNDRGEITESTIANAAFLIDGALCTPPLHCGLLPGVCRGRLLAEGRLRERVVTVAEALRAGEVYLMNALRGIQRVPIIPPPGGETPSPPRP